MSGCCHVRGHLYKLGLVDVPICSRCQNTEEKALRVLCYCRDQWELSYRHFAANQLKHSADCKVPISKPILLQAAGEMKHGEAD